MVMDVLALPRQGHYVLPRSLKPSRIGGPRPLYTRLLMRVARLKALPPSTSNERKRVETAGLFPYTFQS
jgi:hypothetical protein